MAKKTNAAPAPADGAEPRVVRAPAADIYESGGRLALALDLPGVAPEEVEVTVERRTLRIRGRGRRTSPEGYRPVYAEYAEADFERAFTLSDDLDLDKITARHTQGVLTLEFPKMEAVKPRRIEIARG